MGQIPRSSGRISAESSAVPTIRSRRALLAPRLLLR